MLQAQQTNCIFLYYKCQLYAHHRIKQQFFLFRRFYRKHLSCKQCVKHITARKLHSVEAANPHYELENIIANNNYSLLCNPFDCLAYSVLPAEASKINISLAVSKAQVKQLSRGYNRMGNMVVHWEDRLLSQLSTPEGLLQSIEQTPFVRHDNKIQTSTVPETVSDNMLDSVGLHHDIMMENRLERIWELYELKAIEFLPFMMAPSQIIFFLYGFYRARLPCPKFLNELNSILLKRQYIYCLSNHKISRRLLIQKTSSHMTNKTNLSNHHSKNPISLQLFDSTNLALLLKSLTMHSNNFVDLILIILHELSQYTTLRPENVLCIITSIVRLYENSHFLTRVDYHGLKSDKDMTESLTLRLCTAIISQLHSQISLIKHSMICNKDGFEASLLMVRFIILLLKKSEEKRESKLVKKYPLIYDMKHIVFLLDALHHWLKECIIILNGRDLYRVVQCIGSICQLCLQYPFRNMDILFDSVIAGRQNSTDTCHLNLLTDETSKENLLSNLMKEISELSHELQVTELKTIEQQFDGISTYITQRHGNNRILQFQWRNWSVSSGTKYNNTRLTRCTVQIYRYPTSKTIKCLWLFHELFFRLTYFVLNSFFNRYKLTRTFYFYTVLSEFVSYLNARRFLLDNVPVISNKFRKQVKL